MLLFSTTCGGGLGHCRGGGGGGGGGMDGLLASGHVHMIQLGFQVACHKNATGIHACMHFWLRFLMKISFVHGQILVAFWCQAP